MTNSEIVRLWRVAAAPRIPLARLPEVEPADTVVYVTLSGYGVLNEVVGTACALTEEDVRILIEALLAAVDGEATHTVNMNTRPNTEEVT